MSPKRIPATFDVRDVFTPSTRGGTILPPTHPPPPPQPPVGRFAGYTMFHQSTLAITSLFDLGFDGGITLTTLSNLSKTYNLLLFGVSDIVARSFVKVGLALRAYGNHGTMTIVALDNRKVEIARSQPKEFLGAQNGYLSHMWSHGLTLGYSGVSYFKLEFDVVEDVGNLMVVDEAPFFSFQGTSAGTGGGGGGTTGGGGGGGGNTGGGVAADLRNLYLQKYSHGSVEVIVDGTSIQEAIDSMPIAGGKVLVKESATPYAAFTFKNKSYTSYCSVMSFPGHVPRVVGTGGDSEGNERAVLISGSDHCGVYGLDISSYNAAGHQYADAVFTRTSHHLAIWCSLLHDAVHGAGIADDGQGGCNHVDIAYNRIYNNAGFLDTFASGISMFKLANIGGGDDSDGYSNRVIGNIIFNNLNDGSYGGAITDGNGVIIDISNGDYSSAPIGFTGHTLVANNIVVNNGGRGVHAFFSRNVHQLFNTTAFNLRSGTMGGEAEVSQYGNLSGSESQYNLIQTSVSRTEWFNGNASTITPNNNVIVAGSVPTISGTNVDRTSVGSAYFVAPNLTSPVAAGWRPVAADKFTVTGSFLNALSSWPDADGRYRPVSGEWTAGAVEATSTNASNSSMPTADLPGLHIVFSDDFLVDAPLGSWGPGITQVPAAYSGHWRQYGDGTPDTSGQNNGTPSGYYSSKVVSVSNSILKKYVHTEGGVHMAAALLPNFGTNLGNQLYGRYSIRMRADGVEGFKVAYLLWPQSETWPRDGEIDFPEADLSSVTSAFMHRQDATVGGDQDFFNGGVTLADWHTYTIDWGPSSCKFYVDDTLIGEATSRIPDTPMHYILQTETALSGVEPPDSASGYVEIDWIVIWERV